jgi:GntR family transcriptional regulator of gluconate operon
LEQLVKKENLANLVAKKIRLSIILGNYPDGMHLAEPELAREFGTSRGPIRDALLILVREGFLEKQITGRVVVRTFTAQDIHNLYEFRYMLECQSIMTALSQADRKLPIKELLATADIMSRPITTTEEFSSRDMEFHRLLVSLSNNKSLLQAWSVMEETIVSILEITNQGNPRADSIIGKHKAIIELLEKRDASNAVRLLKEHLVEAEEVMIKNISILTSGNGKR